MKAKLDYMFLSTERPKSNLSFCLFIYVHIYSVREFDIETFSQEKRMVVFVEASVLEDPALARDPRFQVVRDRLQTFRDGTDDLQVIFTFVNSFKVPLVLPDR